MLAILRLTSAGSAQTRTEMAEEKGNSIVDRMVKMDAEGKTTHSKSGGDAFALPGCKRTQKKWLLKQFGNKNKINFTPEEGINFN